MAMRRVGSESEADRLQSVKRALAVLETLAGRPHGVTPKELSQTLGLHLSTSYRLLNTLAAAGYAVRRPGGGLFRLGPRATYLHHGYLEALRPPPPVLAFVHALQVATGETAMLNQLEGDDVVVTAVVPGNHPTAHASGYVGLAAPAHALAGGRTLLAWLPAAELEAYLNSAAAASGSPFPLSNSGALRAELERIRTKGYALDRGDVHPDICCVAAPVIDPTGAVSMAIATVAPAARFGREEPTLVATVLAVARAIGALLLATPSRDEPVGAVQHEPETAAQATIETAVATVAETMSRVS
ncbi:MAG: IclR family transcriptional regulator [Thermomicrobiales bacterium]